MKENSYVTKSSVKVIKRNGVVCDATVQRLKIEGAFDHF